ncbi:restriction endonuclease [Azonexus hydrophilus]|uniref:Restriction endonuclease n=1 Tax=Azonexus hydrophilus TaxID=418702 RepID=A0A1R1IE87_9RHOO|nr:type II restriction endonuclease [Azonexus hydrophilus]OMG56912.1 restriction endonuclease [Azonexus hydrophilus]
MKSGYLSEFFSGVALKTLSAVEADLVRSHQHEFNGVDGLKKLFGQAVGKQKFDAKFIYLTDHDDEPVISEGFLTWYDAREAHPTRSEHRLYFPTTEVSNCAAEGDLLLIGRRQDGSVLVVVAEAESTVANQVRWLFGFSDLVHPGFSVKAETESDQVKLEFASRLILDEIGVAQEEEAPNFLDIMLDRFGKRFPSTRIFSDFARSTIDDLDPRDDPDAVLLAWMDREEVLFRTLERHIVGDRLVEGFAHDVDGFLAFSLSVQNRRKSRVGSAFENHLEEVFLKLGVRYDRTKVTENKSKPDFIFPSIDEYRNPAFPPERLTMLGVKSTCKDRWRQVLVEADRVEEKHLLTMEPSISTAQTDEMRDKKLSLVLPTALHSSYTPAQRGWLMNLTEFIGLVKGRQ